MSIFKNLFGNASEEQPVFDWIPLTSIQELEEIKLSSKRKPVVIFKHSTRCGISRMVLKQFEKSIQDNHKNIPFYYLDLLNYRAISNAISEKLQVLHQSPQLLIVYNEVATIYASHYDTLEVDLSKYLT